MTDRISLFDVAFDRVTLDDAVERVDALARTGGGGMVVTPNVDIVVKAHHDPALLDACRRSPLVIADGMPIVWAARLLGDALPERVAGSDLFPLACVQAARSGHSVFLLGARPGVAARAADELRRRSPSLRIAGTLAPPLGFDRDAAASADVVATIRAARPDILFLALGAPKQELWYETYRDQLDVPVALGVGASFDFIAGAVRRAPRWMQRAGLEWLFRFAQEPRRMFRRYFVDDLAFIGLVAREWRGRRTVRAARG